MTDLATAQTFGNGASLASFAAKGLDLDGVQRLAHWFLVVHMTAKNAPEGGAFEDPTGAVGLPRTNTGGTVLAPDAPVHAPFGPDTRRFVFLIKRGPFSQFDFISLGRNPGNDISVPDESISRFHAFFREMPWGLALVDAKSANGTWANGARVPSQGTGEPAPVASGDAVRVGDIRGVVLDSAAFLALLAATPR